MAKNVAKVKVFISESLEFHHSRSVLPALWPKFNFFLFFVHSRSQWSIRNIDGEIFPICRIPLHVSDTVFFCTEFLRLALHLG